MNEVVEKALTLMWQGTLGIFVVMCVIALVVAGFAYFSKRSRKKNEK